MALQNRKVNSYTARKTLTKTPNSLVSGAGGRANLAPIVSTRKMGAGERLQAPRMTAARQFEGVSSGLESAAPLVAKSVIDYVDDRNRMAATDAHSRLNEELSKIWLGYNEDVLQPDGTYKSVFRPGYANSKDRAAVDGYAGYETAVRAKYEELLDQLSPAEQKYFLAESVNTFTRFLNEGRRHAAGGLREWSAKSLKQDMARMGVDVNNLLVTGSTDQLMPYLQDQFEQIGNKYPVGEYEIEKRKNDILMSVAEYLSTQDNASNKIKLFRDSLVGEISIDSYVGMSKLHKAAIKAELTEARQQRRDAESAHKRRREETDRDLWERTRRKEKITENELDALFEAGLLTISAYRRYAKIHGITGPGLDDTSSVGRLAPRDMYDIETSIIKGEIGADDIPELAQNSSDQSHLFNLLKSTETYSMRDALRRADTITDKMIGTLPGVTATAGANVYSGVRRDVINFKNANPTQEPDLQTIVKENIERVLAVGTPSEKGGSLQVLEHMQPTAIPLAEGKTFIPKDYVSLYMQVQDLKSQYGVDSTDQLPPEIYRAVQKWYVYIRTHADLYNVPKNVRDTWQTIKD